MTGKTRSLVTIPALRAAVVWRAVWSVLMLWLQAGAPALAQEPASGASSVPAQSAERVAVEASPSASPAREEAPPDGYRPLIEAALRARAAGALDQARAYFEQAHALFPNARTLRGLGVVALDMKHYREAVAYLDEALASSKRPLDAELRASTMQLIVRARAHLGRVRLSVAPANASVWFDGAPEDRTAFSAGVGSHELRVTAAGHHAQARVIHVEPERDLDVRVVLQRQASEPVAADTRHERRPVWRNPWLWTAVGVVVLGGVVGGVVASQADRGYRTGSSGMLVGSSQ